uniref:Putative retrotransposon Ty1-copia subclass protein n=1 Tax=Tanacetum cinerariifolium TaxID=118510 RepID=A0A699HUY1_TANCI|nr:putative retrotransposon Ty1-copia subclass protein [Tanacetum cinerariifolium]
MALQMKDGLKDRDIVGRLIQYDILLPELHGNLNAMHQGEHRSKTRPDRLRPDRTDRTKDRIARTGLIYIRSGPVRSGLPGSRHFSRKPSESLLVLRLGKTHVRPRGIILITQEASGSLEYLELIQKEDTYPSKNTSSHHDEGDQEIDEPQSDIIPIRRSNRTRQAPDQMCLNIEAGEYELEDLNEPANYKATLLDLESDKWINALNVEMQSMKDNEVWDLVDLTPNGKGVGSKWLFKKKTNMAGVVHTYKARLVAKCYTQTLRIDYEETFSLVAYIRAIRILIAITVYYDYEI